jgi:hypothetical protein
VILPQISFAHAERLLARAAAFAAPYLARWLGAEEANRVGEWVTRIIISYSASPSPSVDVTDPISVRRLVRSFVLPGIGASADVTAGPGGRPQVTAGPGGRPEDNRDRTRPVN